MGELAGHEQLIVKREVEFAQAIATATYHMVEAQCSAIISDLTLKFYRDKSLALREAYSKAVRERETYESGGSGEVLTWRLRAARKVEERLLSLVEECEQHWIAAVGRHAAALRSKDATEGSVEAVQTERLQALSRSSELYAAALKEALDQARSTAEEPTKQELKEIRQAIRRSDWSDLPEYLGSDERTRRDCLHCGGSLPAGRKRFCCIDCHRMHLEAYGTAVRPKMRAFGTDG